MTAQKEHRETNRHKGPTAMMTNDRTFYSWATAKNDNGTFSAVVTRHGENVATEELKRVPCKSRAIAKAHGIKWCRYLIQEHNKVAA
jgi:hypothetical protein